ncbi:ABC transporter permease, partial [Elstera litoralis]
GASAVFWGLPEHLALATHLTILALFALSLHLLVGLAGLLSLGHAAFFGLGAYTAGLLARAGWTEPLTGLVAAAAIGLLAGAAAGAILGRLRGLAALMVTLGLGLLLHEAALRLPGVTGGEDGLSGLDTAPLFGQFSFDLWGKTGYWYALAVLAGAFWLVSRLEAAPFGVSLRALHDNPTRLQALGIAQTARVRTAYALSGALAGLAGGLLTQTTQFVSVEVFSFHRSADLLVMLILGGVGRRYGALLGPVLYGVLREGFAAWHPAYWGAGLGLALMAIVLFAPHGLLGLRLFRPK